MNQRQAAALTDPLSTYDLAHIERCRSVAEAGDGAFLVVVLAVDR